jgi:hypothetical protein
MRLRVARIIPTSMYAMGAGVNAVFALFFIQADSRIHFLVDPRRARAISD